MMKIKVWYLIINSGDGSSSVKHYPTEELALDGLDKEIFKEGWDITFDVDYSMIDTEDYTDEAHS